MTDEPDITRNGLNQALADALDLAQEGWSHALDYLRDKWDYGGRHAAVCDVLRASEEAEMALQMPEGDQMRLLGAYEAYVGLRARLWDLLEWPENASRPSDAELVEQIEAVMAGKDPERPR